MTLRSNDFLSISTRPGVYALLWRVGGCAYVGEGKNARQRIRHHLYDQNSSITTAGGSGWTLDVAQVASVNWWEHSEFSEDHVRQAAEIVADRVLRPDKRTKVRNERARALAKTPEFKTRMRALFLAEPTGHVVLPTIAQRVADLELRVRTLEARQPPEEFRQQPTPVLKSRWSRRT